MIKHKLESFMEKRRCTLLGVGPMSQNCVDAVIELANEHGIPLILIASRRQIEAEQFGGGYVNNWSTERFAEYVFDQDKAGRVILARDHGGPWQNDLEKRERLSLRRAMASAKESFKVDIESGFEIIHIDPSVDIFGKPSLDDVLHRLFELYEYCWSVAQRSNREVIFEIGTEEQSGSTNTPEELEFVLGETFRYCEKQKLPSPSFVVIQTGTRVIETRNVGSFDSPVRVAGELPAEIQVPKVIDICNRYRILMKEHNTDYLSDEALAWHPKLGIHSANVAPEFGVTETQAFVHLLRSHHLNPLLERFAKLAFESQKWKKWMAPDSNASDFDKAVIAGHYVFADAEFSEIKREAQSVLKTKNIIIDDILKAQIKYAILRYVKNFRLQRLV